MRSALLRAALAVGGLVLLLALVEVGLRAAGAIFLARQDLRNRASASGDGTTTILCIGESTTALGGVDSYPTQLADVLRERGRRVRVVNKGIPAVNTDVVVGRLPMWIAENEPDIVIAMMGVNDPPDEDVGGPFAQGVRAMRVYKLGVWIADGLRARFGEGPQHPEERRRRLAAAVAARPDDADAAAQYAAFLVSVGQDAEARPVLERALAARPDDVRVRLALARALYRAGEGARASAMLQAVADEPAADAARWKAVAIELTLGDDLERAQALLVAHPDLEATRLLQGAYAQRAAKAIAAGDLERAEAVLATAASLTAPHDANFVVHKQRAVLARARGDYAAADAELAIVHRLLTARQTTMTVRNYRTLRDIVRRTGVRLIAMQYPLRSVEPLQALVEGDPSVVVVDNEKPFRAALARGSWDAYFTDTFADFGHLNRAGNRLLAENAAAAVERVLDEANAPVR
jgi:lysophospholipase L1-like esterase